MTRMLIRFKEKLLPGQQGYFLATYRLLKPLPPIGVGMDLEEQPDEEHVFYYIDLNDRARVLAELQSEMARGVP